MNSPESDSAEPKSKLLALYRPYNQYVGNDLAIFLDLYHDPLYLPMQVPIVHSTNSEGEYIIVGSQNVTIDSDPDTHTIAFTSSCAPLRYRGTSSFPGTFIICKRADTQTHLAFGFTLPVKILPEVGLPESFNPAVPIFGSLKSESPPAWFARYHARVPRCTAYRDIIIPPEFQEPLDTLWMQSALYGNQPGLGFEEENAVFLPDSYNSISPLTMYYDNRFNGGLDNNFNIYAN